METIIGLAILMVVIAVAKNTTPSYESDGYESQLEGQELMSKLFKFFSGKD